ESVYGEGSTFIVTIPQKIVDSRTLDEAPDVADKASDELEAFVVDNYKVLVVDDNLINRKVAMGFMKNYGFELYEAESGPQAIEMVKQTKFNIIFMDHMMPEMDGIEATKIIREECGPNGRSPVVVALTANAMAGVREKFLNNGFQDFIAKPLDRKPLNEVLSRWIPNAYKQMVKEDDDETAHSQPKIQFDDIHIDGIDIEEAKKHHTGEVEDF
ncbi:MAG: response regulator, partial [Lachnospiraceae bacterium]|nr:response regulator [Lachnospiraceae bacterium]